MADYGASDTSTTSLGTNQFPISEVYVPNTSLIALEGGPVSTDSGGKKSSPVSTYTKDGNDLTQGAQADTAATSGTGSWSVIALLKGILTKLLGTIAVSGTFWQATQPISASSLPLPTGAAQEAGHLATIDTSTSAVNTATGAQADATYTSGSGSIIAILKGIFGKVAGTLTISGTVTSNAGTNLNTSLLALESGGHLASIDSHTPASGQTTMSASSPVAFASDQTPLTSATATRTNVVAAASDTSLLASNASRKGAIFYNDSTAILYLAYGSGAATTSSYSVQVPAQGYFELPPAPIFTGAIRGIWSAANGNCRVTELS